MNKIYGTPDATAQDTVSAPADIPPNIVSHVERFCSTTTMHGFYQARFLKYKFSRYLFVVVIVVFQLVAISEVIILGRAFNRNPVSSSITIKNLGVDVLRKMHLTVCIRDWVSQTRAEHHKYTSFDVAAILSVMQPLPEFNTSIRPSMRMTEQLKHTNKAGLEKIIKQIMKPYPIENCSGLKINGPGHLCLKLNPQIQSVYSSSGGLMMHFNIPRYLNDTHEIQNAPTTSEGYIQWTMYHLEDGPIPVLLENKMHYKHINQVMQKVDLKSYVNFVDCIKDTHALMLPNGYLTRRCNQECVQKSIIEKRFNCFIPAFSNSETLNVCMLPDIVPKYNENSFFKYFAHWQNDVLALDNIRDCRHRMDCLNKQGCDNWSIKNTMMNENEREVYGNDMHFSFQFAEDYEMIETVPIFSWETMLSFLGGQWGLWTGASMISVVHLFYWICEAAYEYLVNRIRNSKK